MPDFLTLFALVGVVLTVSALASGLVERAPLSFPILFLGLGLLLGESGFGMLVVGPHDPLLETVAIISLAFVLFLDAMKMRPADVGANWYVPMLVLGPGTLLTIALIAGAAMLLLHLPLAQALLLGAILASTDPVVLRDVVRNPRLPRAVRQVLSIEAGTNDLVVLPLVLILIGVTRGKQGGAAEWALFVGQVLLLGPAIGAAVGGVGARLMAFADSRTPIRREYQALFGVGLVLLAYSAAAAGGADGFLAAFAAGAAIVLLDYQLCDCFMEYGENTAEVAMLLAFVLFGAVLSSLLQTIPFLPAFALAIITICVARPVAIGLVLHKASLSPSARRFIGWFGPRGLASLLLALLTVQGHAPNAEYLLAVAGLVVVVSVVAHGVSATPLVNWYGRRVTGQTLPEERESTAADLLGEHPDEVPRLNPAALNEWLQSANPPLVLDVRGRAEWRDDVPRIPGSLHAFPDSIPEWAKEQSRDRPIVAYCNCIGGATSARAARQLNALGFKASFLDSGLAGWKAQFPLEGDTAAAPGGHGTPKELPTVCNHLDQARRVKPSGKTCAHCHAAGEEPVALRLCRVCGHVGCCDSTPGQHATQHFRETGHAIMQSFEPGEDWAWCYVDEMVVKLRDEG